MKIKIDKVTSIIVIYKPNKSHFYKCLELQKKNFSKIIIVNNDPVLNLTNLDSKQIKVLNNKKNLGLATGFNIGIIEAIKNKAEMVALFDQDSKLSDKYCSNMVKEINDHAKKFKKTALFSSRYYNEINHSLSNIISLHSLFLRRKNPPQSNQVFYPDYVISSGSFIPTKIFEDIGLMDDKLFITFIDIEWCLRAKAKGYEIALFNNIYFDHRLGHFRSTFFRKFYPTHDKSYMYYFFRNSFYLYFYSKIKTNWKIIDFLRNILRILFYIFIVKKGFLYIPSIFNGILDGIKNNMNKA